MNPDELKGALEAVIYAADEPATVDQLAAALGEEKPTVRAALDEILAACLADHRGIEIRKVAGGYKFYTKTQHHEVVARFVKSLKPPVRLTVPALETLAVIAYKQPVTLPEIQEIRGVNCAGVVQTLLERRLIITAGRKPVIGRPILYRTTKDFLMRFGLNDVDELPSLKEFEQLARAALGTDGGLAPGEPAETPAGVPVPPPNLTTAQLPAEPPQAASVAESNGLPPLAAEPAAAGTEDTSLPAEPSPVTPAPESVRKMAAGEGGTR